MKLDETQHEWIWLFNEMQRRHTSLSFPFLSSSPREYDSTRSILYVGKATEGPWKEEKEECNCLADYRALPSRFLNDLPATKKLSAFWRFGKALSELDAPKRPYQNLIWTNLAKIGVCRGTPTEKIFQEQKALAIETLRTEMKVYRPALVVFVTGDYHPEIVHEVTVPQAEWRRDLERTGLWWRPAARNLPALMWTYHPERKRRTTLDVWLRKAKELLFITS